ncbi:MAG: hypothetical protein AB1Z23_12890 [Eubacteriales bacterium]
MSTTSLYVELVIIGMQTITWMLLIIDCIEHGIIKSIISYSNNLFLAIVFLSISYVIGMIFDRLANLIFQRPENKIRKKSGLQAKSSLLVDETNKMQEHQSYTRSKYRILRSSSLNIFIISILVTFNIFFNYTKNFYLLGTVLIIGFILSALSVWSTIDTLRNFYNKARVIELHNNPGK